MIPYTTHAKVILALSEGLKTTKDIAAAIDLSEDRVGQMLNRLADERLAEQVKKPGRVANAYAEWALK